MSDLSVVLSAKKSWALGDCRSNGWSLLAPKKGECLVIFPDGVTYKKWAGIDELETVNKVEAEIYDYAVSGMGVQVSSTLLKKPFEENKPTVLVLWGPGNYKSFGGTYITPPLGACGLKIVFDPGYFIQDVGADTFESTNCPAYSGTYTVSGRNCHYRLRIHANGGSTYGNYAQYFKNIEIHNPHFRDPAPWVHAGLEESHGYNLQHVIGGGIFNARIEQTGDEAVELDYCINCMIDQPRVWRSNFTGENGGSSVSIKNGCENIIVSNPICYGNTPDAWDASTTYAARQRVIVGNQIYKSAQNNNTNNLVTDGAWWTAITPINSGVTIKIINAHPVKNVTFINPVISDVGYAFIKLESTGAAMTDIKVIGGHGAGSNNFGIDVTGNNQISDVTISNFEMSGTYKKPFNITSANIDNMIVDVNFDGATGCTDLTAGSVYMMQALATWKDVKFTGKYRNVTGVLGNFQGKNVYFDGAEFDNCGPFNSNTRVFGAQGNAPRADEMYGVKNCHFRACRMPGTVNGNFAAHLYEFSDNTFEPINETNGTTTFYTFFINSCIKVRGNKGLPGCIAYVLSTDAPNYNGVQEYLDFSDNEFLGSYSITGIATGTAVIRVNPSAAIKAPHIVNNKINHQGGLTSASGTVDKGLIVIGANVDKALVALNNGGKSNYSGSGVATVLNQGTNTTLVGNV